VLVDILATSVSGTDDPEERVNLGAELDAHLLATALTDAEGRFEVLVAPRQGDL